MGWTRLQLTPEIIRCMNPADQAKFAPGTQVHIEPPPSDEAEKVTQANFAIACKERGWRPVWHRTDKRSTANRGCPDFIVAAKGTSFWIEFKRPGEELAPDQKVFQIQLAENGVQMHTVFSAAEAVEVIEQYAACR